MLKDISDFKSTKKQRSWVSANFRMYEVDKETRLVTVYFLAVIYFMFQSKTIYYENNDLVDKKPLPHS
jgi:hypothetical protein